MLKAIMQSESYSFIHLFIILACLYLVIINIYFFKIIFAVFWKIISGIKYFFVNLIWDNIVRFAKFIYNSGIILAWEWVKSVFWKIYDFFAFVINKIIEFAKNVFNIGKKVTSKVVEAGEKVYHFAEEVAVNTFHIGEGIVVKGINIVKAIYNFLREKFIAAYNAIKSAIESVIDVFKGVGEFITGITESILNAF